MFQTIGHQLVYDQAARNSRINVQIDVAGVYFQIHKRRPGHLSIAKAIVDHMGGQIGFETSSGKGTTFYLELPA